MYGIKKGCLNIQTAIPFFRYYKISNSIEFLELAKKFVIHIYYFKEMMVAFQCILIALLLIYTLNVML